MQLKPETVLFNTNIGVYWCQEAPFFVSCLLKYLKNLQGSGKNVTFAIHF